MFVGADATPKLAISAPCAGPVTSSVPFVSSSPAVASGLPSPSAAVSGTVRIPPYSVTPLTKSFAVFTSCALPSPVFSNAPVPYWPDRVRFAPAATSATSVSPG